MTPDIMEFSDPLESLNSMIPGVVIRRCQELFLWLMWYVEAEEGEVPWVVPLRGH